MVSNTIYVLATSADFKECHAMMRLAGQTAELGIPTVVAKRDDKVIGFVSTAPLRKTKAVVVHKILISPDISRVGQCITVIRLIEHYEGVLQRCGVKWYHAAVDKKNTHFNQLIERSFQVSPYASDHTNNWFKREIA